MSHLRVFGSVCYKHVLSATRKKLNDKRKLMLLIGYHNTISYKFYYPVTNKVEVNMYVIVKEIKAWDGTRLNPTLVQC